MLKTVVVFDSGFGGELFADYIEDKVPVFEVIRVIDWRHSSEINKNPRLARKCAAKALRPYIGRVDVIVFANYLLSMTSLGYFRRKFKNQKFVGFEFQKPHQRQTTLVLTTNAVLKTIPFHLATFGRKTIPAALDGWPELIDDGELNPLFVRHHLVGYKTFKPKKVYLACTQFADIKPIIHQIFGPTVGIHDGYRDTLSQLCHILRLRGLDGRKKK